jgi:ATP-dependent protease Clp ATPase subunit
MPEPVIHWAFCEVRTVIAGPNVYICSDCVAVCNEILRHVSQPRRWLRSLLRTPGCRGEKKCLSAE